MIAVFRHFNGHIEVFIGNTFLFSADTMAEAVRELKLMEGEK